MSEYRESVVLKTNTPEYGEAYLKIWFSDNEAASAHCDACIGYSLYGPDKRHELDGGEMDYNSEKADYNTIEDAIPDILDFAFGFAADHEMTDLDPDDFE